MPRIKSDKVTNVVKVTDLEETTGENEVVRPKLTDPEWNDYVLNQLLPDEKDADGNPKVHGLRRLVEEILGEVVHSAPGDHFEGATQANGMRATVSHIVKIAWNCNRDDIRTFGSVADCYAGNTDEEYARHAAATADTKAEARALRKALRLKKVASEEMTSVPVTESGLGQYIVPSQERGINKLCRDMDINVTAFINSGPSGYQYKNFNQIRYTTAQQMLERLNLYLQKMANIPAEIRGYDPNWKEAEI